MIKVSLEIFLVRLFNTPGTYPLGYRLVSVNAAPRVYIEGVKGNASLPPRLNRSLIDPHALHCAPRRYVMSTLISIDRYQKFTSNLDRTISNLLRPIMIRILII